MSSERPTVASPDGALSFLFGVFGLLMWYMPLHALSGNALFSMGILWIVLSFGALAASVLNLVRGKPKGNINMMAAILLGLFPGISTLISLFARLNGFVYQPKAASLMYITGSVFCFGVMFGRRGKPLYRVVCTFFVGAGLLFLGLGSLLDLKVFTIAGAWSMLGYSVLTFYYGLSVMYGLYGSQLPQGRILDRKKFGLHQEHLVRPVYGTISSPGMIVAFVSSTFGVLSFAGGVFEMPADSLLAAGVIRSLLGSVYFIGAMLNLMKGNKAGNLNLIFSVCFGLLSGSNLVVTVLSDTVAVNVMPSIYGILQIAAGLYLAALLPVMTSLPLYQWCASVCSSSALLLFGISEISGIPLFSQMAGWLFLAFALLNLYTGLGAVIEELPQGITPRELFRFWKEQGKGF